MRFIRVKTILDLLLIVSLAESCPLWFISSSSTGEACKCGDDLNGVVICNETTKKISLQFYYCMTYNDILNETVVGPCFVACSGRVYPCRVTNQIESSSISQINQEMCGDLKREGQLCGRCSEGHGLPVYSYLIECVNCSSSDFKHNLVKSIAITFIPLTAFYFVVIVFKISVLTGNMVAYVLTCQLVTIPALLRAIRKDDRNKYLMVWFTIWNLDVFRSLHAPFCIHPKLNILHMLMLEYLVGLYPLFLIFLTYIAVMLHDRYPIVVKLWSPGQKFFRFLRKEWDIRGSLVQTFATFLILSYVKILNISFDLLTPVVLNTSSGKTLNKTFLFINAEIEYFGSYHRPYAILALAILTVFSILPMILLLLYGCGYFQKCLMKCGLNTLMLSTFMDAFQGCYRQECRFYAGLYLFVRIVFLLTISLVKYPVCIAAFGIYSVLGAGSVAFFQPYKVKWHNTIDIAFFLMLTILAFYGISHIYLQPVHPQLPIKDDFSHVITILITAVLTYGGVNIINKMLPKTLCLHFKKLLQYGLRKIRGAEQPVENHLYRFEENENAPLIIH